MKSYLDRPDLLGQVSAIDFWPDEWPRRCGFDPALADKRSPEFDHRLKPARSGG
jgi:hypothetical protein